MRTRPNRLDRKLYQDALATPEELLPECYPRLDYFPLGAFLYDCVPVALNPQPAEFVYVKSNGDAKLDVFISSWNALWDAAQYRHNIQWREERPDQLKWLDTVRNRNLQFLPYGLTGNRYCAHSALLGIGRSLQLQPRSGHIVWKLLTDKRLQRAQHQRRQRPARPRARRGGAHPRRAQSDRRIG